MMSDLDLYTVKHIKLVTGEEILAEIIEEDDYDVVMRRALKLQTDIAPDKTRYHSFRTFMTYMDDPETFVILKSPSIVAVTYPMPQMLQQYKMTIEEIENGQDYQQQREAAKVATSMLDELMDKMSDNNDDEGGDSDSNVIKFPTMH
tara:strand:- start:25885 stop:26325 length:441 start_codon:yes stop_codon:yes gene_type:complete